MARFVGEDIRSLVKMRAEIHEYRDMLLGRIDLPIANGVMSLMESATAMYGRATEMASEIMRAERDGRVTKDSPLYDFRTVELRYFLEMCGKYIELGSRRVTNARMEFELHYGAF